MSRFVRGITLTPQERRRAVPDSPGSAVRSHTCQATMPDGTSCAVGYRRLAPRFHQFDFGAPIRQRVCLDGFLPGGAPGIEAKARELSVQAFHKCCAAEQEAMRRKGVPKGCARPTGPPQLPSQVAEAYAGHYAVCIRTGGGRLFQEGTAYASPDGAARDLAKGRHAEIRLRGAQRLVVGICCRWARRWQEAAFVPRPSAVNDPDSREATPVDEPAQAA